MPPTMDELLPEGHPARVVAAFVDSLTPDDWAAMGVALEPRRMGVPATIRAPCSAFGSTAS